MCIDLCMQVDAEKTCIDLMKSQVLLIFEKRENIFFKNPFSCFNVT